MAYVKFRAWLNVSPQPRERSKVYLSAVWTQNIVNIHRSQCLPRWAFNCLSWSTDFHGINFHSLVREVNASSYHTRQRLEMRLSGKLFLGMTAVLCITTFSRVLGFLADGSWESSVCPKGTLMILTVDFPPFQPHCTTPVLFIYFMPRYRNPAFPSFPM